MKFSTNFFSKPFSILFTLLVCLSGCTPINNQALSITDDHPAAAKKKLLTAVLPLSNLSGTPAPLEDMRQLLTNSFEKQGLSVLDSETVKQFIIKHRIRYVGGADETTLRDWRFEAGADAVLITSVETYSDTFPPKVALTCRLVSTGNNPKILWIDSVSLAGNDSVGILQLSLIKDPRELLNKAVQYLSSSLGKYLAGEIYSTGSQRDIIKFWPKVFFRSPVFQPEWKYTVAVVPFVNLSGRKFAGEIIALNFVRQLMTQDNFTVIEPGITRDALLRGRVVMVDGISITDAYDLFRSLHAELILAGKIFDYQGSEGASGKATVDFSALAIEKQSLEVVWTCQSHNSEDYGVFLFDWGTINTAHGIADEMVSSALGTLVEPD